MKVDDANTNDISWEDIEKYLHEDPYQDFLKQIPPSVYKMALIEEDRPNVIETILKVLRERDPQNATEEYAEKIADRMQDLAQMVLKNRK